MCAVFFTKTFFASFFFFFFGEASENVERVVKKLPTLLKAVLL